MFDKSIWEFATLIAAHAPHLWEGRAIVVDQALYYFWKHHRQLVQQYLQNFSRLQSAAVDSEETVQEKCENIKEILHLDLLIRVFCAALVRLDYQKNKVQAEPVARSVFTGQLHIKNEALKSLLELTKSNSRVAVRLNDLRKYLEHHTDLLLGHIILPIDNWDFAHDVSRAQSYKHVDFADILLVNESYSPWDAINQAGEFLQWMESVISDQHESTWEQLKGSILRCFPSGAFHEHGTFKPIQRAIEPKIKSVL